MRTGRQVIFYTVLLSITHSFAQSTIKRDSSLPAATVEACVQYALAHQPFIQEAYIDEKIVDEEISSRLADWYPQIGVSGNYQHYFKLPSAALGADSTGKRQIVQTGVRNTSTLSLSATQNIFDRDVLLATRTAGDVRQQIKQITTQSKIAITVAVSKAFYDILATEQQISLLEDDINRLTRSLQDAYNQYKGGLVDKIDYKRATIALNNSKSQKKTYEEQLVAKYSYLKYLMGFPQESGLKVEYDSLQLEKDAQLDTLQQLQVKDRIEYRLLQTQRSLLRANLTYEKWGYLPTVSAFGEYNLAYLSEKFKDLYSYSFPNSYAGLSVSIPIFQGFRRIHLVRAANLQLQRNDWSFVSLEDSINNEYTTALTNYKATLYDYTLQKENVDIANEVYNTVQLQYKAGIKTYLDVIIAESDLRTSQVNYTNAVYELLMNKIDVERALGAIRY